jgi:AcrR family transcriptional regulator
MVTTRNTRADVVAAAGRLFAEKGYHGTSMRDLGKELGLVGSSIYAHVSSKQDLLVEVVEAGARLFEESSERALVTDGSAIERMNALVEGHVDVLLDNPDISRTFLNEARVLDAEHRQQVVRARDHYERGFRSVIREGVVDGSFRPDTDPRTSSILILSMLNAIDRWYQPDGALDRSHLVDELTDFVVAALS